MDASDNARSVRLARRRGFKLAAATAFVAVVVTVLVGPAIAAPPPTAVGGDVSPVSRYAPFIYLAPHEKYRPMDAGSFIAKSSLSWAHDKCSDDKVADRTKVSAERLGTGGYRHQIANSLCIDHGAQHPSNTLTRPQLGNKDGVPEGEGFFLNFPNGLRGGQGTGAPVYYEYSPQRYVTYWFFYAFNDASTNVFDHEGDWERISVQLDSRNHAVTVAYYKHDGYCTVPWQVAGKYKGHPKAFSAFGTHATYPWVGFHSIAHGLSDDYTGWGDGWATFNRLVNARDQGWFGYGGAWGEVGEHSDSTGPLGPSRFKGAVPTDWSRPC